jgi:micrococcal nuclease
MALDPRTLQSGATACRGPLLGRVSRIVDGDTMHVNGVSEIGEWDIRFIGVNAPEISHMGSTPDCFGNEATVFTNQLAGRLVWLTFDAGCNDPYDRTLAYVWVGGGTGDLWQRQLLRRGFARTLSIDPNTSFAGVFEGEQSTAEAAGTGLWSACP